MRRSLLVNIALGVVVTVALLGALEGVGRLIQRRRPPRQVAKYIWDWQRMWGGDFYTIHADATGWPPDQEFNRDGLRDRVHTLEKPERTWRVAILGDSVTLGAGLTPREAYPQVLERRLRARGRRVEVMNVALWGWSTRQERLAYEKIARRYRPDEVILGVCLNDVPELQNNLARPPGWLTWAHERSAFVRVLVHAEGREIASVEELFAPARSPQVDAAFRRFFDEVLRLREVVRADGASFQVIVFPFRFQMLRGARPPLAQERIAAFCRAEAIPLLDMQPALARAGAFAFLDYDHLSVDGAQLIAEALETSGWLPEGHSDAAVLRTLAAREGVARPTLGVLRRALDSGEAELRGAAAWGLGRLAGDDVARAALLSRALRADPSPGVRGAAARALGQTGAVAAESRSALFAALGDVSEVVRFEACHALASTPLAGERDLAPLMRAFGSQDESVRAFAAWSLGRLGPQAAPAVPVLARALTRGDPARAAIERALAEMGAAAAEAVPPLLDGLDAPDAGRRAGAARALGRMGPRAEAAVPTLGACLRDDDADVRAEAARALGRIGVASRIAVPGLVEALADREAHVRAMAARALGLIPGGQLARSALERARRDRDRKVAREAEAALARLGGEDRPAPADEQ